MKELPKLLPLPNISAQKSRPREKTVVECHLKVSWKISHSERVICTSTFDIYSGFRTCCFMSHLILVHLQHPVSDGLDLPQEY